MKFHIITLGCKVNSCDSDTIAETLQKNGLKFVNENEEADIYIINTCAVTAESERKSRQLIRHTKNSHPLASIVAVGCWSRAAGGSEKISEADLIISERKADEIAKAIIEHFNIEEQAKDFYCKTENSLSNGKVRSAVKVQDGCNRYCSYCIIPYVRDKLSSVSVEDVVKKVDELCLRGFKEVVLTGIHIASYDDNGKKLIDLIRAVSEMTNIKRIRLGSLEPKLITQEFALELSKINKFCPHFHLSLQSGSDSVLKRMNRRYTAEEYIEACRSIRKVMPKAVFTTDIIVGFPAESEDEFLKSMEIVEEVGFAHVHVFPYSRRQGTPAADYEGQISKAVKHERVNALITKCAEVAEEVNKGFIGQKLHVLCEYINSEGLSEGYSENYLRVVFSSRCDVVNEIVEVKVLSSESGVLYGEII